MGTVRHSDSDPAPTASMPQPAPGPPEVVAVMVPVEYVPHVARLIAELESKSRPMLPPERHSLAPEAHTADWPVAELSRLASWRSRTFETVLPIMDYLAEQPETFHRVIDIVAAMHLPPSKVTGAMAGLTRIVKAHHDFTSLGLPVRRRLAREPGGPQQVSYCMSAEQARRWLQVRRPNWGSTSAD